ncbi:MAG: PEP-CTERM sorting domain-containing protein [Okeania sp. SIO2F4]|uniref:choice-of-anchor W domain-containing protein n=1 Tax=Okeania sp. SIO2F4 TaxID=2607790 RepID=UPI0014293C40|nr:choice-of-anchor W domain-containing protein [Okeania sp. SIO2F4]NES03128.1 PEP-CTERM sorting domain-containing protein [Okeania sp. SIO2F4]
MNKCKSFLGLAALAIGFLGAPVSANAFTLGGVINGEEAFNQLGATIDVAAEGRIGDLGGAAEHEFNIHYDNENGDGQTVSTEYRYFDWVSGQGEDFTLTFDDGMLTYEIGGQKLEERITDTFNDLFIRTTARKQNNSVVVDNLMLNGQAIAENSSFACFEGCDYWNSSQYLWLTDLEESFTLTGTTTMTWTGDAKDLKDKTAPHRSELAFQLKLGDVIMGEGLADELVTVPEPVSMSLFSVGVVGLAMAGLRRQKK